MCAGSWYFRNLHMQFVLTNWAFVINDLQVKDMREFVFDFGAKRDIRETPEASLIVEFGNQQVMKMAKKSKGKVKCVVKGVKGLVFEIPQSSEGRVRCVVDTMSEWRGV
jgi:hypothetical protein